MKSSKLIYYLCYYSHVCFFYCFWGFFLVLILLNHFDIEINVYLGYLFFLLFGLWSGSATALFATRYLKKFHQKDFDEKKRHK